MAEDIKVGLIIIVSVGEELFGDEVSDSEGFVVPSLAVENSLVGHDQPLSRIGVLLVESLGKVKELGLHVQCGVLVLDVLEMLLGTWRELHNLIVNLSEGDARELRLRHRDKVLALGNVIELLAAKFRGGAVTVRAFKAIWRVVLLWTGQVNFMRNPLGKVEVPFHPIDS